ncbi:uncharacterized protein B0T23DRAFT_393442 [Neurospora hispaniola]|uniref:Uncharacterized protein n=1 Tax=Neurospora hispaniola TaxID=588809 RepID=A0AAJ0ICB7_9PEZI|nr:hypothetical protein B0T23DRAFT_393442 [Neurospora hispaniola]
MDGLTLISVSINQASILKPSLSHLRLTSSSFSHLYTSTQAYLYQVTHHCKCSDILIMSDFQSKNKQSRVPYNVRTPKFSNFPNPEPFHRNAYRSMATYNVMLKAWKKQPEPSMISCFVVTLLRPWWDM